MSDVAYNAPSLVSIIVPTRNRMRPLGNLLDSLLRLDLAAAPHIELLVVDNGSTDGTADMVARFAQRAPFPVDRVFEERPGISAARNAGIRRASGDIVLFTDDDCIVRPDWVKTAVSSLSRRAEDELCIVGGRVELYDPTHAHVSLRIGSDPEELRDFSQIYGFVIGCNLAVDRRVFDRVGLFDVRLGAGTKLPAADETDFIYRALQQSVRIRYAPQMLVLHDHGRNEADAQRLYAGYMIGIGAFVAKHLLAGDPRLLKLQYWELRRTLAHGFAPGCMALAKSHVDVCRGMIRYVRHGLGRQVA